MASKFLRAALHVSRAARSAAAAASRAARSAAVVAAASRANRPGSGGAAASDLFMRSSSVDSPPRRSPWVSPAPSSHGVESFPDDTITVPEGMVDFEADEKDLESDEAMWALYERWCKAFNQERSHDEMTRRFSKFKEIVLLVDRENKATPNKLELNKFSDGKLMETCRGYRKLTTPDSCVVRKRKNGGYEVLYGKLKGVPEGHELKSIN